LCYNFIVPERLPNAENAFIDPRKLRDYALAPEHETGKYKAEFFMQMGYSQNEWRVLEDDIRHQHLTQPAEKGKPSSFSDKYIITAPLRGPNGAVRNVTTVWILRIGKNQCELVTIEPAKRLRRNL
jgi:hypothetical protein